MRKLCIGLVLACLLWLPAAAQPNYNVCFNSLDADVDGAMSKGEFLIAVSDGDTTVFDTADLDKDGQVSHEEWEAFKTSQGFEEHE